MFGPNSCFEHHEKIDHCHRDPEFFTTYENLTQSIQDKFNLHNYDILFIPGSGTIGVESVMFSTKRRIKVVGIDGVFRERWKKMADYYNRFKTRSYEELYCHLETSCSQVFDSRDRLVDAVSSFPYYPIPNETRIFITCSNKQLASYVGLSIVGVRKDYWKHLHDSSTFSYLNLSRYREYARLNQTPSTTPTNIFNHLLQTINKFDIDDFRNKVDRISDKIVNIIGCNGIIGDKSGPVITIRKNKIPIKLARKYNLYGLHTGKSWYQIFTYSHEEKDYDDFINDFDCFEG